jgi:hypothetical protein
VLWLDATVDYQYIAVKDASINHRVTPDTKDVGGDFVANQVTVDINKFFGLLG